MNAWLAGSYPWIKAFHIVAVVAWMAGLLYLPRLFVYHAEVPATSARAAMLLLMERRLLRGIMAPAVVMTIGFGGMLLATPGIVDWDRGWIWAKLGLVAGLVLFHHFLARCHRAFGEGTNRRSARFFRMVNELPTMALIAIAILVVVKPF
jgi:putative membrane protein